MSATLTAVSEPKVIAGGIAVDDRGSLSFVNDFNFQGVKRFYLIENHKIGFVRAWHGHKHEGKYFCPVSGTFVIGAVKVDNWSNPSRNLKPAKFVLSAAKPSVLYIPPGYANGLMSLSEGARLMVFSTAGLEESQGDDFRFESRFWDIWRVEER